MQISLIYREIIDFIAAGTTPQNLVDFLSIRRSKRSDCRFDLS